MQEITFAFVSELYEDHLDDLRVVRKELQELYADHRQAVGKAQLDDLEAEITYLLLRATRPRNVVEIGCLHGWSTSWILRALRDNGSGTLHSFNRVDAATRRVPPELSADRWRFTHGDVRTRLGEFPDAIDYLFVDATHTSRFARWYVRTVLPTLAPGTPVSVHDVHHRANPLPFSEGRVLLEWLGARGHSSFTTAAAKSPEVCRELERRRTNWGLAEPIHTGRDNPMVFFTSA